MKEIWTSLLHTLGLAWWVEVKTNTPECTYYFGPFVSFGEAASLKGGYVEDLEQEGAQGIRVAIQRCKPEKLTIEHETSQDVVRSALPIFSNQV